MPTIDTHALDGSTSGTVELPDAWFAAPVNVPAMHQVVTAQLANARRGTAKTKSRSEVRGGGAKPWRQKGTGRARQGSIRAPQWTGGGVVHGPTGEQDHSKRVSKKLKRIALASALTDRATSGDVRVVSDLALDAPSTRTAVAALRALELDTRRVLVVLAGRDEPTWRSLRNVTRVHLLTVDQLNTHDVLVSDVVVFGPGAVERIGTGTRADARELASSGTAGPGTASQEVATA